MCAKAHVDTFGVDSLPNPPFRTVDVFFLQRRVGKGTLVPSKEGWEGSHVRVRAQQRAQVRTTLVPSKCAQTLVPSCIVIHLARKRATRHNARAHHANALHTRSFPVFPVVPRQIPTQSQTRYIRCLEIFLFFAPFV